MARVRLGVVLLVPGPLADRVDGMRTAFGDPARTQVPPHITLVPPVNVAVGDLPAALAVLRAAAGRATPLDLRLGPIRVFPGAEHVAFLGVDGEPGALDRLRRLRAAVFQPPLERELDHDFVPHVTVTQGIDSARLAAVLAATHDLQAAPASFDRLHLLQEEHPDTGKVWRPVADFALAPPVIVGRGGLPIELTPGELIDPEALAVNPDLAVSAAVPDDTRPLVVVARQEGSVAGALWGWTAGPVATETDRWTGRPDPELERHLASAWRSAAADRGAR